MFFFSSRRRHTRWPRDWSSDVCSSDLRGTPSSLWLNHVFHDVFGLRVRLEERTADFYRSEERRVGKERRSRRSQDEERQKDNSRAYDMIRQTDMRIESQYDGSEIDE